MTENLKNHDFIEVDYTGKLADGTVFDTTLEKVAKESKIHVDKAVYKPAEVCIGEGQILPGLDKEFVGKDIGKEYIVTLKPEDAFGKRDVKKMKIVPMSTFKEHKLDPRPGLQIDVDGERGTVSRVSGGRVIVNFNHPLAGREVTYTFTIVRKIEDTNEKISSFLNTVLRIPKENIKIDIKEENATVELPMALPPQFTEALATKLVEVVGVKKVEFTQKTTSK